MRAAILAAALLSAGCDPEPVESDIWVHRLTAPPLSMTAAVENALDPERRSVTLSSGAAVGLGCTEYCPRGLGDRLRCEGIAIAIEPPELAEVHQAFHLDGRRGSTVLVAGAPGTGTLTITSPCARTGYRLVID